MKLVQNQALKRSKLSKFEAICICWLIICKVINSRTRGKPFCNKFLHLNCTYNGFYSIENRNCVWTTLILPFQINLVIRAKWKLFFVAIFVCYQWSPFFWIFSCFHGTIVTLHTISSMFMYRYNSWYTHFQQKILWWLKMKTYIVWAVDNETDFDFNVCIVFSVVYETRKSM